MKKNVLLMALAFTFVVPFFVGIPAVQAGSTGRMTTGAVVGGLVGGIVGTMIVNSHRPCRQYCERRIVTQPVYVQQPVYVAEPVYVPQSGVYQEVRYYQPQPVVYQHSYTVYR